MHAKKSYWYLLVLSALGLAAWACGSFAPPEECTNSGFDEEAFAAHFNDMQLVSRHRRAWRIGTGE